MKKRQIYPTSLMIILVTTIFISQAYAQRFKKYKSKTKYNTSSLANKKVKGSRPVSPQNANDTNKEDIFGRGTGINSVSSAQNKKYVNLNPETAFGPEVITSFDFPSTSLIDLTKHMQELTGINLVLDKDLKGKITIMAPSPITVGDAWKAYLTALNLNGYTMVKSGAFYKIVSSRDIRYTPTKIYTGSYVPNTENYVMKILPLKHINSTEVTRSFRPFMSRYGRIIDIKQTNTVIVQDTGANINRLVRLIKFVDVPGHEENLLIIPVKNSSAQELAKLLQKILKGSGRSKSRSSRKKRQISINDITAETRTNSIIAMANAQGAKRLRTLINKLDTKVLSASSGQVHVYYLRHGDSETLAKTLSSLVGSSTSTKGSRFSKSRSSNELAALFNTQVKITADKDNNALVVVASPTDYLTLEHVIKKLDIARDQVYIEGMIMETSVGDDQKVGVSIVGAYGKGYTDRIGSSTNGDLMGLIQSKGVPSLTGFFLGGGAGKEVDLGGGISVKSVNGLLTALATDSKTNLLATPQILALDNTEAVFEVGEQVPTLEKTTAPNGATTVSVKAQDVSLKLKITPHINKATRFIKMEIDQNMKDFSGRPLPEAVGSQALGIVMRSAVTTVIVRDRDTMAMGGMMRDKEIVKETKVPLLGDIPILGWLFKHKSKNVQKVNLLIFLTPTILSSYENTVAKKLKDVLNRRAVHLKDAVGEKGAFPTTMKELYQKAKKQDEGPLYDTGSTRAFNKHTTIGPAEEEEEEEEEEPAVEEVGIEEADLEEIDEIVEKDDE
ncbi:MAG: type II secretion system secretin GspD [Bacteriovoracaceae bacterium]|nr:type II secretion system secretin GspD [Bacteriovoracaceae bacterium]